MVNLLNMEQLKILSGKSYPLGASVQPGGVNFSLFSKNCHQVELLLFDGLDADFPSRVIQLDRKFNRTFYYWHLFVEGVSHGQLYAYRVDGPFDPAKGHRFDGSKVLLDPYSRAVVAGDRYDRQAAKSWGDNCAHAMRSVVIDPRRYDWEGDEFPRLPFSKSIIYEMHLGGFTRHPSSGVAPAKRGTYAGLIEKIPYLQRLGINTVELLPVQQFDEQDAPGSLTNYWGYSPVAFFAPHAGYCSSKNPTHPVDEFRDMVKALHKAGIEVILDVVFNHTAEGDIDGPLLSFRGIENRGYYILDRTDLSRYLDFTGCGHTIDANHSIVRRMILDCLRYWVSEMHVDGFRFDLASVFSRDEWGEPLKNPPIIWEIESDPVLAGSKIIAEAWDAAGLYQVGSFIGHRWAEWNGPFRDDVRRFMRGDNGTVRNFSARLTGSRDLFPQVDREPNRSINFVTAHDGFTLNDLVSYNSKHNELNRHNNKDGSDHNFSWNSGLEGPTSDPTIQSLRLKQLKNFFSILLISQGTPMILMGDEIRRSQHGNNNAYCQDNELSWFNWQDVERESDLLRFVRQLVSLVQTCSVFREEKFWNNGSIQDRLTWHGARLGQPDWRDNSHSLAFTLINAVCSERLHIIFNAYNQGLDFELPPLPPGHMWGRLVDTSLPSPEDITSLGDAPQIPVSQYSVQPHSTVILLAKV